MVFYITYHGRKIPFGNYVIWDDVNGRFLAFDNIDELRRAMDAYGYTHNHKAVADGYYTQYGYFSNDILYDLYLKIKFPEIYSSTAQRIVSKNFEKYNKNPDIFRKELLANPNVIKEITISHETYEQKRLKEILQELKKDFETWQHIDVEHTPGAKQNLEREIREYEALKSYINVPDKTTIDYKPTTKNYEHESSTKSTYSEKDLKPVVSVPEFVAPTTNVISHAEHNKYIILAIIILAIVIVLGFIIKR